MSKPGFWSAAVLLGAYAIAVPATAADQPALAGCYEHTYDAGHLAKHKKQLVVRATLDVKAAPSGRTAPFTVTGELNLWVRGNKQSFSSSGACEPKGGALRCNGSLSAAETKKCKTETDGVRNCRINSADSGGFRIEPKPEGVLVTISPRLELIPGSSDIGPYLSLSETNPENHAFLLTKTANPCP